MSKVFIVILACLLLVGCFVGDEGAEDDLVGPYYIRGHSGLYNVHIGYEDKEYGGIGLIEEPITAVGYNDDYIIASQGVDEKNYYILKVVKSGVHSDAQKAVMGPFNKIDFDNKLKELGLGSTIELKQEYKIK